MTTVTTAAPDPKQQEMATIFRWHLRIRFLTGFVVLLVMGILRVMEWLDFPFTPFSIVCLVMMFINQPYDWILKRAKNYQLVFVVNQLVDILLITYGGHFAGGMNAYPVVLMYPVVFIFTGIVLNPKMSYLMANLSFAAYGTMVLGEHFGIFPNIPIGQYEMPGIARLAFTMIIWVFNNIIVFVVTYAVEKLHQRENELRILNQELDAFVHTVSHDLKNPLTGILGFGGLLEKQYKGGMDAKGQEYLERIVKSANGMNELIDDLLSLSKISRMKNPYENVPIGEVVKAITERIRFDLLKHDVRLEIQKDLPTVRCDRIKITEVFF